MGDIFARRASQNVGHVQWRICVNSSQNYKILLERPTSAQNRNIFATPRV